MPKLNPTSNEKPTNSPAAVAHLVSDLKDLHKLGAVKLAEGNTIEEAPPLRQAPPPKKISKHL